MAIKARETITIIKERDVNATWRFYRIASSTSAPSQPTEAQGKAYVSDQTLPTGWSVAEPAYDGASTNSLYTCDLTSFTDGGVSWSAVSKSSSYEAAKQAYNLADTTAGNLTTEINQRKAEYGTCATAAATQAKAVTCANFALYNGARIQVTFTYANTYVSGAVQLNVNSTGAKSIYIGNAATSSSNLLLWAAGAKMEFVYDGTGWVLQNAPNSLYGTCATAAGTAPKAVTSAGAVICKGTTISVQMSYANSVASPTLNVGSTLARSIYANNAVLTAKSIYNWQAASTQKFTFDGQFWRMDDDTAKFNASEAAKTATGYLTDLSNGVYVHAEGTTADPTASTAKGVRITDVVDVIRNGTSVAEFGNGMVTLGKHDTVNDNYMVLASDGLHFGCMEYEALAFLADMENGISTFMNGEGLIFEDEHENQQVVFDYMNDQYTFAGNVFQKNHSGPYGFIGARKTVSLSSEKTIKTATGTAVCSISLEAGVWLVLCNVRWSSNSSGIRRCNFSTTSGSTDMNYQIGACAGVCQIRWPTVVAPTSTTTYYLNAYQNSGSSLTLPTTGNGVTAIRLV